MSAEKAAVRTSGRCGLSDPWLHIKAKSTKIAIGCPYISSCIKFIVLYIITICDCVVFAINWNFNVILKAFSYVPSSR